MANMDDSSNVPSRSLEPCSFSCPRQPSRHRLAVTPVHVDELAGGFALPGEWPGSSRQITIETCRDFYRQLVRPSSIPCRAKLTAMFSS